MKRKRLYLDNCCFNRPYDSQESVSVRIETIAKLAIQEKIRQGLFELCWSYILDFENDNNIHLEKKIEIIKWKNLSIVDMTENEEILNIMRRMVLIGLKPLDALHVGCAISGGAEYFITVDKGILKYVPRIKEIRMLNPAVFIDEMEE